MADKELEEQLMEAGTKLLELPSEVDELLLLLDQIESCLSMVDQSPSKSMQNALSPSMKALVAKDLLRHTDTDVKVSVASCVNEITRITAPDTPYSDDEMKQIFKLIVGAFEMLWDTSSHSYTKRVSILEIGAKIRSCVVMLDLECDGLILEMFQHFLKTIQNYHPTNIFTSMETIMSLVLEESEEISPDLLYLLLTTVKKDNQDVLPIARKLGENVLKSCTSKLKPYLLNAVKSLGTSPNDYSNIVASICQVASDTKEHLDDERSSRKKMGSDTPPQATQELKPEAACPGEVDVVSEKSKQFTGSNGDAQNVKDDSSGFVASPKKAESSQPAPQAGLVEPDSLDHKLAEAEDKTDQTSQKNRGQDPNVLPDVDKEITGFLSQKISPNKDKSLSKRGRPRTKKEIPKDDDNSLSEDQSIDKPVSPPEQEKEDVEDVPLPTTSQNEPVKVASHSPSQILVDRGHSKRGRPAKAKKGSANEDDNPLSEDQSINKPVSPSGAENEAVEEVPLSTTSQDEPVKVASPPPSQSLADKSRSKRGRPARSKKGKTKKDTDHCSPSVPKGTSLIEQVVSEAPPELEEKSNRSLGKKGLVDKESEEEKVSDASIDSEEKSNKHSGKKGQVDNEKEEEKEKGSEATSDSEEKSLKRSKKKVDMKSSSSDDSEEKRLKRSRKKIDMKSSNSDVSLAKKQVQKTKNGKNLSTTEKELSGKSSNKKTISTSKSIEKPTSKNQKLPEETRRTTLKRKHTPAKEEEQATDLSSPNASSKIVFSYWQGLSFDIGGTREDTPSHSPSPSTSTLTNKKRKGPVSTNMEALVGIIEGGFSYFQAESEAQRQERQVESEAQRQERQADRLERQAERVAAEMDRDDLRAERSEMKAERERARAEKQATKAEEEAYSINELIKALMEMKKLGVIRMNLIRQVSVRLCEKLEFRKAFLGASTMEEKHFFLQMMGGRDSD